LEQPTVQLSGNQGTTRTPNMEQYPAGMLAQSKRWSHCHNPHQNVYESRLGRSLEDLTSDDDNYASTWGREDNETRARRHMKQGREKCIVKTNNRKRTVPYHNGQKV